MKKNLAITLEGLLHPKSGQESFSSDFLGRLPTKSKFHAVISTKGSIGEFEVTCALAKQIYKRKESSLIISRNQWLPSEKSVAQQYDIDVLNNTEEYVHSKKSHKRKGLSSPEIIQICHHWSFGHQSLEELVNSFDDRFDNIILLQHTGGAIPARIAVNRMLTFCESLHVPAPVNSSHYELEPLFEYLRLKQTIMPESENRNIIIHPFRNREVLFTLPQINFDEKNEKWAFLEQEYLSGYDKLLKNLNEFS